MTKRFCPRQLSWAGGVPRSLAHRFIEPSPSSTVGHALGNSVSCCVLERLLRNLLFSANLVASQPPDYWKTCQGKAGFLLDHLVEISQTLSVLVSQIQEDGPLWQAF